MQSAIIYVFSGTMNTLLTAKMTKAKFERQGVSTTIYEICKPFNDVPSPNDFDFAGFAYPVHAFNSPQFFLSFVKSLPSTNKKAFIIKTSGEPFHLNDASSQKLYNILTNKGFDVTLDKHLLMPYNIVFRYSSELAKQMYLYNQKLCASLAIDFLDGKRMQFKYKIRHTITSAIFRIQWIGATINGRFYKADKQKCNMCMFCVDNCPSKNITLENDTLCFDGECTMCMRCVMLCPKDAINPGILRFWKVNGAYDFEKILRDNTIRGNFINEDTKGYFRLFKKYYRKADEELFIDPKDYDEDQEIKMHT